ncbi:hypothetical protein BDR26DRAFT_866236 [Obelidium mucronatum]|nr:hypothetical protein BDR26DRAFT_866236 [Obelidium mucronatum]
MRLCLKQLCPVLLLSASVTAAPPRNGSIPDAFVDLNVYLRPSQVTIFDICGTCNDTIGSPPAGCNAALVAKECSYIPGRIGRNGAAIGTIHSLLGNNIIIQFNYDSWANRKMEFYLVQTAVSGLGSTFQPISLSDYKNPNDPLPGSFFPQDKGHNPASFVMQVPPRIALGSGYAVIYKYYLEKSTSVYNSSTLTHLTIDQDYSTWVVPMQSPLSSNPSPTGNSTGTQDGSSNLVQTAWTAVIVSLVVLALIMTVCGFWFGRYAKRRKEGSGIVGGGDGGVGDSTDGFVGNTSTMATMRSYGSREMAMMNYIPDENQFLTASTGFDSRGTYGRNSSHGRSLYDGHNSDDEVVIYRKSVDKLRSYAGSVASGVSGGSAGTNGSQPKSILKRREDVEREALEAQLYDPVVIGLHNMQRGNANLGGGVHSVPHGVSPAKKVVKFKDHIESPLFDYAVPGISNTSIPEGLFVDEGEGDNAFDDSNLQFNDGGKERDVGNILGKAVHVDEDDDEYNSDVSDGWRKEH